MRGNSFNAGSLTWIPRFVAAHISVCICMCVYMYRDHERDELQHRLPHVVTEVRVCRRCVSICVSICVSVRMSVCHSIRICVCLCMYVCLSQRVWVHMKLAKTQTTSWAFSGMRAVCSSACCCVLQTVGICVRIRALRSVCGACAQKHVPPPAGIQVLMNSRITWRIGEFWNHTLQNSQFRRSTELIFEGGTLAHRYLCLKKTRTNLSTQYTKRERMGVYLIWAKFKRKYPTQYISIYICVYIYIYILICNMYIYMYICVYVYVNIHIYICICIYVYIYIYIYICIRVRVCVCVEVCMYMYIYIYTYIYIHIYVFVCVCVFKYVCMYVCVCVCACVYVILGGDRWR